MTPTPMAYRKKPVVIEAVLNDALGDSSEVAAWCGGEVVPDGSGAIVIHTLEGDHRADLGDFIIRGVKGEFYPCKPDIFEATYDLLVGTTLASLAAREGVPGFVLGSEA